MSLSSSSGASLRDEDTKMTTQPGNAGHNYENDPTTTGSAPITSAKRQHGEKAKGQSKARVACKFFNSKTGCRAGSACPYLHEDVGSVEKKPSEASKVQTPSSSGGPLKPQEQQQNRRYQAPLVSRSKVVTKPVSKAQSEDPRKFQIDQLKRRFAPHESDGDDETILTFQLNPSDPDFPFELDGGLQCRLHVPKDFPKDSPVLDVTNKEMGRGYQVNVEKGFAELVQSMPDSTLLGYINNLDRRLENLLSGEKADTIKIVRNTAAKAEPPVPELEPPPPSPPLEPVRPVYQGPSYTRQQLSESETKRKADVRQLEARLGKMPLFEKAADGVSYMVPVTPRRRDELPVPLQNVKSVELIVPLLYPLEPCRIRIFGVPREAADPTEHGFVQYVRKNPKGNLLGFLNYLSSSMHILATTPMEKEDDQHLEIPDVPLTEDSDKKQAVQEEEEAYGNTLVTRQAEIEDDRPHVHYVPRPLEWSMPQYEDELSESDGGSLSENDHENDDGADGPPPASEGHEEGPERGISLSLPYLELHGIELLELVSLALTVRCLRCKDTLDIHRIRHEAPKLDSCKKCAQAFSVAYRREFMHAGSIKAGYLDLDGCTVADLLPSQFTPTCSACSTPQPPPGIVSVRGESSMSVCRECHSRMTPKNRPPPRKKVRENLGIAAGTELPNRGRCEHYRKSYRWFRFSCCSKVFACDRCHDGATDHPNEHANRMICGWCSREQLFRPETCAFCRNDVVGRRAAGFWEGGKGTRDKTLMSRKDPRKWRRRAVGVPPGQGSLKK